MDIDVDDLEAVLRTSVYDGIYEGISQAVPMLKQKQKAIFNGQNVWFHEWGKSDGDSVAIIEYQDGNCTTVDVYNLKFEEWESDA